MKRLFDLLFSLIALTIFLIPMLVISIILKLIEKHPIIFRQERIGIDGKKFEILKFQTMINDIPTQTGKILRRTGIDELPQFFNVLKGDMSIVGPRALTRYDIERLGWNTTYYLQRWKVKPGISGFAQIYGGQHKKTSWFWDKKYSENAGLAVDLIVILISFLMNILGKQRVRNLIWTKKSLR